jgi:tetratricopeptide (TPR) repeat protein
MNDPRRALEKGIRLFRTSSWGPALAEFLKIDAVKFSVEENAELAYYLGLCYTKLERYEDALLYLEQVITASPDPLRLYQCRMALAYIYAITGRSRLAEFELKRLATRGFESVQMYTTLAYTAWAQRQFQKAIDCYEKALELDENSATALNGLGYILVDSDLDVERGLRLCRKAVDQKPQNAAYLDSLGWALYKTGDNGEAKTWIRKALELAPHQQEIKEHMKIVAVPDHER